VTNPQRHCERSEAIHAVAERKTVSLPDDAAGVLPHDWEYGFRVCAKGRIRNNALSCVSQNQNLFSLRVRPKATKFAIIRIVIGGIRRPNCDEIIAFLNDEFSQVLTVQG
jgi:hypothetical protein